jgi:acyl-CoA thioesterase-2
MHSPERLLEILTLGRLSDDAFEGRSEGLQGRIFGGQVVAQTLVAAYGTVDSFPCHSLHGYFVRAGDAAKPIRFEVERTRDGASFSTRRVKALQDGRLIFDLIASFQAPAEGFEFQTPMPERPPVEDIPSFREQRLRMAERAGEPQTAALSIDFPLDVRTPDEQGEVVGPPERESWARFPIPIGADQRLHDVLLAYFSDLNLLATAMRPHGLYWHTKGLQSASLDHSVWFHRPSNFNDWHLFLTDTPSTARTRGMMRGTVYNADGRLVASVAQEGLLRMQPG